MQKRPYNSYCGNFLTIVSIENPLKSILAYKKYLKKKTRKACKLRRKNMSRQLLQQVVSGELEAAEKSKADFDRSRVFKKKAVTAIMPATTFYPNVA